MTIKSLLLSARKGELSSVLGLTELARLMVSHKLDGCEHSDFIAAVGFLNTLADAEVLAVQRVVRQVEVPNTFEVFEPYHEDSRGRNYVSFIHRKPGQLGEWKTSTCHQGKSSWPAGARPVYREEIGEPQVSAQNLSICLGTYQSDFEEANYNSKALQAWLKQHGASLAVARTDSPVVSPQQITAAAALLPELALALGRAALLTTYGLWHTAKLTNPDLAKTLEALSASDKYKPAKQGIYVIADLRAGLRLHDPYLELLFLPEQSRGESTKGSDLQSAWS